MAQQIAKNKPLYVVTDRSAKFLTENEALYLKNYRTTFNANIFEGSPVEGGNFGKGTPSRSNKKYALITLPAGDNITMGVYECEETNEIYFANWNSNNFHAWYRIDGLTLLPSILIIDPKLNFSCDPAHKIPPHRVSIRPKYKRVGVKSRVIIEKYLMWTDGREWQGFLNVEAAIKTNGFDADLFPYWKLRAPHFDREELFQLAVRPPNQAPVANPIAPVASDIGKGNYFLDKSVQLALKYEYTDGRPTTVGPYSNPIALKGSACDINNSNLPRCFNVTINVGSPLVERILFLQRQCGGDWQLYDTIERFGQTAANDGDYWTRTDDWASYGYDAIANTITYKYCGDRQLGILDQNDINTFQSDLPLVSIALTAAGDSVLLADNLYGYDNLPKIDADKFEASVVDASDGVLVKTQRITVYAFLARNSTLNQFVYRKSGETKIRFGGLVVNVSGSTVTGFATVKDGGTTNIEGDEFGLYFDGTNKGFLAYLAGTPYYAISKQYLLSKDGSMLNIDVADTAEKETAIINLFNAGGIVVQKFDFIVPPGKYIVRLASHKYDTTTNYAKTSTWVLGKISRSKLTNYAPFLKVGYDSTNSQLDSQVKEMEVDVCNGDWDSLKQADSNLFFIFIPNYYNGGTNVYTRDCKLIDGYVYEDEVAKIPVERIDYTHVLHHEGLIQYTRKGFVTDHNGFYFQYQAKRHAHNGEVQFSGIANCKSYAVIAATHINQDGEKNPSLPTYLPNINVSLRDQLGSYGDCNRILIRGKITNNISGIGYSGVGVTSSNGGTVYSGSDGSFELVVHEGNSFARTDRIYINTSGTGGCSFVPAAGGCMPIYTYTLGNVLCFYCQVRVYDQQFNISVQAVSQPNNSLKDGGGYFTGIALYDKALRGEFVQEFNFVEIPTFMESASIQLSKIKITLTEDITVPDDLKWFSFYRTQNTKLQRYIQWVGDKIEFLNNNGDVVPTGDGAIRARISIQSLVDYNNQNNFASTATYQFTKGDILRIYDDGNGNFIDPAVNGILDFEILGTNFNDSIEKGTISVAKTDNGTTTTTTTPTDVIGDGKTIIIPFDKRLLSLNGIVNSSITNESDACGFWIEIQTPKDTSQVDRFCEIVGMYPITDGKIRAGEWMLDTFDTYYQSRSIHVAQCTGKAILHPFASASITDFFGSGCDSCGRFLVKDTQAEQKWYPDDVIKSDEFVNQGRVNGLGRFREVNRKQYKGNELGGIVAMHAQNKLIVFICETNWFMANYDLNVVQVSDAGLVVPTAGQIIGEQFQKVSNKFGCALEDTGTIVLNDMDGVVFWLDSRNEAVVLMDYRNATDIALIDNKSYFTNKLTTIRQFNELLPEVDYLSNLYDKAMAFDFKLRELHVSFRPRQGLDTAAQHFINVERGVLYSAPETFTFSLDQKKWTQFQTFVPEIYGTLRKASSGIELISFAAGIPYFHNSFDVNTFNKFYGVSDTQIVEVAFNAGDKDKTYQALIAQSPTMKYIVDRIRTNRPRMFTYIPASQWKRKNNSWYASLLRDMSSYPDTLHPVVSMLHDGGAKISGEYCIVRFVRDLERLNEYNEVDSFFMQFIGFEKTK